ncbi:hypothetical protein ACJX0J_013838, partial [Zea mays]
KSWNVLEQLAVGGLILSSQFYSILVCKLPNTGTITNKKERSEYLCTDVKKESRKWEVHFHHQMGEGDGTNYLHLYLRSLVLGSVGMRKSSIFFTSLKLVYGVNGILIRISLFSPDFLSHIMNFPMARGPLEYKMVRIFIHSSPWWSFIPTKAKNNSHINMYSFSCSFLLLGSFLTVKILPCGCHS